MSLTKHNKRSTVFKTNTWTTALQENLNKRDPTQINYAAESPSPWWPRGVLIYAHINKLMIIAKEENHTQTHKQNRKDKLEWKNILSYNW